MDSFELNKIIAAVLMVALLVIGIGKISDIVFHVKNNITSFIQEAHMSILHCVCELLEEKLKK